MPDRKTSRPNIRRRGDTYTWYAYTTGGDGKRRQISQGGFRTIAEADADRIATLQDLRHGVYVPADRVTLTDFINDEWLPARRADLEPSTWRSYEAKLRLHVLPHIGGLPLQELTPIHLNRLYAQLLETPHVETKPGHTHAPQLTLRIVELRALGLSAQAIANQVRGEHHPGADHLTRHAVAGILRRSRQRQASNDQPQRRLSPRSVGMIHAIVSKALSDAMRWSRVQRNAAEAATPPKQPRLNDHSRNTWTVDDLQRFFTWLGDNRYRYPWAFAATSGARRGEILGLRWQDIDLDRATATLDNQLTTDHQHHVVYKPGSKTGRGHTIHLDPATIELLTDWRERQNTEKQLLGDAYQDHDWIFCHEDGRHYHPERFSREFLRKQQQYNAAHPDTPLPRLTIHGLRHTWATIALENKVHLKVVSDRLNHSTTHITAEVYSHVTEPIAREAADLVGGLILDLD
ncbi:MAG: site-specific integrase [Pseudomonadota bacterium]